MIPKNRHTRSIVAVLLILTITFCLTFIVSRKTQRIPGLDLTEDRVYTLTDGTRQIVDGLRQPLTMKLFYSKELVNKAGQDRLVELNNYYYYVRDLLKTYERISDGRLQLVDLDPRPFSDAEEEADRLKIRRFQTGLEHEGFYFGLAVTSDSAAQQTVEYFDTQDQSQVEYKISEAIELATRRKKTKLGVLSSLSITGGGMSDMMRQMMMMQGRQVEEPWAIFQDIGRYYEVQDVAADAETIDEELDYLMVVHPKNLSEKTLFAIDQFVMRGGKLLCFVDPYCFLGDRAPRNPQDPFGGMNHDASSNLNRLTDAWGVTLETGEFAGDLSLAGRPDGGRQVGRTRFIGSLALRGDQCLNEHDPITQGLKGGLDMLFAGALKKTDEPPAGVSVEALLHTTDKGNTWAASGYEIAGPAGPDLQGLTRKFTEGSSPVLLAVKITGKLPSAFPEGLPKSGENGDEVADPDKPEGADAKEGEAGDAKGDETGEAKPDETGEAKPDEKPAAPAHLTESAEDGAVIVVADVDMITNDMAYRRMMLGLVSPANSTPDLVLNALEHLAGSSSLMSIRSRARVQRPFTVVDEIEERADLATQAQTQRINDEIQQFEQKLNELRSQATEENVGLLQNEAINEQRKLEVEIREKRRELKEVQKGKLGEIESLGSRVKFLNRVLLPGLVLLVGVVITFARNQRRRAHIAAAGDRS